MRNSLDVALHLEYLPASDFELAAVGSRLRAPLHVDGEGSSAAACSFYDTFDGRLRSKRVRLTHEDGFLRLHDDSGRELAVLATASVPETLRPEDLPAGPLRDRLAPLCGIRVLLRSAQIETTREALAVLDDEDKTVARLVNEQATLRNGARAGEQLRARLHLFGVRGYDDEVRRVRAVLEKELGITPASETLADEIRARTGSAPAGLSADVELTPDLPADRAAVALCTRLLHAIDANLPGTLADLDTEFLHDLRVAVRRTRSLLRELKTVFPPEPLAHFRTEFKWVQEITGPSRDLDVYILDFDDFSQAVPAALRADLEVLRSLLQDHQRAERVQMEDALQSERMQALLREWPDFLDRLPSEAIDDRPDAVTPIGDLAARRIDRVYRQMVRMGNAIDDDSPHEALHELRKKGKELRYLLEFFSPLFAAKVTKPMVKTLKALQDVLGRFQDREIQAAMIRSLGDEIGARPGGAGALMAMGVLVERLEEQQDEARAEFHACFTAFSSPEQRALVKKTFR